MKWYQKLWVWIKILLRMYEKEIRKLVNDLLDLAYQNLDAKIVRSITPQIRNKIKNQLIAEIIINKIDVTTTSGKSAVSAMVLSMINEVMKE